jgi:hypothetical protein
MDDQKKDMLEFPLESVNLPQAIVLMMQAAAKTRDVNRVDIVSNTDATVHLKVDNERLALLAEKLEARIEDELEKVKVPQPEPEPEPDEFQDAIAEDIHLVLTDDHLDVHQVIHKGVVFGKLCNETVKNSEEGDRTTCIKQFGHETEHEDEWGNIR